MVKIITFVVIAELLILALLLTGCKSVITGDDLKIGYGTNEAYNVSGPNITIDADGAITCTTDDPVNFPCRVKYAGGWEAWENIIKVTMLPFEAALQFVGRSLLPVTN